jgi:predicted Rossmann fold nucleotide-binding protein DprA/Smf involved in DNA uptake
MYTGSKTKHTPNIIDRFHLDYPSSLTIRLANEAPDRLRAIGQLELLNLPKTALFCSNRCPGDAILAAYDQAQHWRDAGRCVISGFHSAIEKECLQILLRGLQPIIICPGRSIETMRIPKEWRPGIEEGRVLLLSPFESSQRRVTATLAERRNRLVAAMADEVYFAHIAPDGRTARLAEQVAMWGIPVCGRYGMKKCRN